MGSRDLPILRWTLQKKVNTDFIKIPPGSFTYKTLFTFHLDTILVLGFGFV